MHAMNSVLHFVKNKLFQNCLSHYEKYMIYEIAKGMLQWQRNCALSGTCVLLMAESCRSNQTTSDVHTMTSADPCVISRSVCVSPWWILWMLL